MVSSAPCVSLCVSPNLSCSGARTYVSLGTQVAKWLDATLYTTNFRPVALREHVKVGNVLYTAQGAALRDLGPPSSKADPDQLARLCAETVVEGGRVRGSA